MARNDLANFYNRQENYNKSLEIVTETLAADPVNSRALYHGAIAYLMIGQQQQAISLFHRASVSMSSSYPLHAKVRLAIIQGDAADLEELVKAVEETIDHGVEWSNYSYLLSLIYLAQGKEQLALNAFQQAISRGFTDYQWAQKDPMLVSLQTKPEFLILLNQICERVASMREQVIKFENAAPPS